MCENQLKHWACCVFHCLQVFLAKVLNHMVPSISLGNIDSKWVSRDKKRVRDRCFGERPAAGFRLKEQVGQNLSRSQGIFAPLCLRERSQEQIFF